MPDQDVREFVGTTRDEAVARATKHFGVSEEELDVRVISDEVDIAGLAGRVMVVARVPEKPPVLLSLIHI